MLCSFFFPISGGTAIYFILFLSRILHPFREILRDLSSVILTVNMICLFVSVSTFDVLNTVKRHMRFLHGNENQCPVLQIGRASYCYNSKNKIV